MAANSSVYICLFFLLVYAKIKSLEKSLLPPNKICNHQVNTWTIIEESNHHNKRQINGERFVAVLSPTAIDPSKKKFLLRLLMVCGDVENNPGPPKRAPKYPCTECNKGVTSRSKAINCDSCNEWTHVKCSGSLTEKQYDDLVVSENDFNFTCKNCLWFELPYTQT